MANANVKTSIKEILGDDIYASISFSPDECKTIFDTLSQSNLIFETAEDLSFVKKFNMMPDSPAFLVENTVPFNSKKSSNIYRATSTDNFMTLPPSMTMAWPD